MFPKRSWQVAYSLLIVPALAGFAQADRDGGERAIDPPFLDAPRSIREEATYSVPLAAEVLILPEHAFLEALQFRAFSAAPEEGKVRAVELGSQGNSPSSLGLVGHFKSGRGEQLSFQGSVFLVARDARRITGSEDLQITDYYPAAVALSGHTPWYGVGVAFAMRDVAGLSASRCCGPRRLCARTNPDPPRPLPGPEPCFAMGENLCPPDTDVMSSPNPAEGMREQMGEPPISTQIYGSPLTGGLLQLSCIPPLGQRDPCAVMRPNCGPSGGEPDGSATIAGACGDQAVTVRNVPPICTRMTTWETLPAECGGYCSQCGYDHQLKRVLPLLCGAKRPVDPNSAVCNPNAQRDAAWNQHLMTIASCTSAHRCRHCESAMKDGSKLCTECNTRGECQKYVDRPAHDPRVQGVNASEEDEQVAPTPLQRHSFESETIYGQGASPTSTPIRVTFDEPVVIVAGTTAAPADVTPKPYLPGLGGADDGRPAKRDPADEPDKPSAQQATTVQGPPAKADPILLGDGSFHIQQTDLSFDGPVRPLEFTRIYNSRSNLRGSLGSNWHHSWEAHIEALHEGNLPVWAAAYCAGGPSPQTAATVSATPSATPSVTPSPSTRPTSDREITCVLYHAADASTRLFILDKGRGLFMPQAGSTDTILQTVETTSVSCSDDNGCASGQRCNDGKCRIEPSGWALRTAEGDILTFNKEGFVVEDRDRFGNGFAVEYEPTPYYELYDHFCLQPRQSLDSKQCRLLAALVGDLGVPQGPHDAWNTTAADFPLPSNVTQAARLDYARTFYLHTLGGGRPRRRGSHRPHLHSPFGFRRLRPTKVTDDLGRTLVFSYHRPADPGAPEAELLKEVRGPAGTVVTFTYSRPSGHPAALNESFLAEASRVDTPATADVVAAQPRTITFTYQNVDAAQARVVRDRYYEYYRRFVRCAFATILPCGKLGHSDVAVGDPVALANQHAYEYAADLADNIVMVRAGRAVESETRYEANPFSRALDRVTAQRYGSTSSTPSPAGDGWQTTLPQGTLEYESAGPRSTGGELTRSFLPRAVAERYPLEALPSGWPAPETPLPPIALGEVSDHEAGIEACDYAAMEYHRKRLPGYRALYDYFDGAALDLLAPLRRSHLSCDQLAVDLLSNPAHNDLFSRLVPITPPQSDKDDYTDHFAELVVGQRARVASNANRICGWTKLTDRDGDVHYYGMSFQGQVLVDAVQKRSGSTFVFGERLYNADGRLLIDRRPLPEGSAWTPNSGYTRHDYDEVDPRGPYTCTAGRLNRWTEWLFEPSTGWRSDAWLRLAEGSEACRWNAWLPFYWSRRANLIRVETRPAGGSVTDERESGPGFFDTSYGRYNTFTYEPLFNQILTAEAGHIERNGSTETDVVDSKLRVTFDYQELSLTSGELDPVLDLLAPWGLKWFHTAAGTYDYGLIQQWQLPLTFRSTDLNGDTILGFPHAQSRPYNKAKGVPILVEQSVPGSQATREWSYVWAPHGRLAVAREPDDRFTSYEYYTIGGTGTPVGAVFGGTAPPLDADVNMGNRGLLGRVRVKRYRDTYLANEGPSRSPCRHLPGPYQWLLPATCRSDVQAQLTALGLPPSAIGHILDSARPSLDTWVTTAFSYSELGLPRYAWDVSGATHLVRDADGRETEVTDGLGNREITAYDRLGFPETVTRLDPNGASLGGTYLDHDEEGHLLYRCDELSPTGCEPRRTSNPPDGMLVRATYSPEGEATRMEDGAGLVRSFDYDEEKRLTVVGDHDATGRSPSRYERRIYTQDGDLAELHVGAASPSARGTAVVTASYDGLRRPLTVADGRTYPWQQAYSSRDLLTARKRDGVGYAQPTPGPIWESTFRYDAFGDLVRRIDNNSQTLHLWRTSGGSIHTWDSTGIGRTNLTYDNLGNVVFAEDPLGSQSLFTWSPSARLRTDSALDLNAQAQRLTTANLWTLDAFGRVKEHTQYGSGLEKRTAYDRGPAGFVREMRDIDGYSTRYTRNYAGWPESIETQRGSNPVAYDTSRYVYDRRGQVQQVTDPSNQATVFTYDGFGQLLERDVPGPQRIHTGYRYDRLGRIEDEIHAVAHLKYRYNAAGDREAVEDLILSRALIDWTHDDLGRLTSATHYNQGLSWLPQTDRTVTSDIVYDNAGRVRVESILLKGRLHATRSHWQVVPPDIWQRDVEYSSGDRWSERYDLAGRLASKQRLVPSPGSQVTFHWWGDAYVGRDQTKGTSSPLRHVVTLDRFGLPLDSTYGAIDVDALGNPVDPAEGRTYCGGMWSAQQCGQPLLSIKTLRYASGRRASQKTRFGNPLAAGVGLTAHASLWQGFKYDEMGRLSAHVEHPGTNTQVGAESYRSHAVTPVDVDALGTTGGSTGWKYLRETAVGGTVDIQSSLGSRWRTVGLRAPGHQLTEVEVDGSQRNVRHDRDGRISRDGVWTYAYDALGALVDAQKGRVRQESYAYDGLGRLVGLADRGGIHTFFTYDGIQKVEAVDATGAALWTSAWGPGIDNLIEWRSAATQEDWLPLVDIRNSVVSAWNVQKQEIQESAEYDPEGRLTLRDAAENVLCEEKRAGAICRTPAAMPFGFQSAWRSGRTGLVYFRNRWYSPELGQFLSHDRLGNLDSFNPYAYIAFDPINGWDPWGLQNMCLSDLCGASGRARGVIEQIDLGRSTSENWRVVFDAFKRNGLSDEEAAQKADLVIHTSQNVGFLVSMALARFGWKPFGGAVEEGVAKRFAGGRPGTGTQPGEPLPDGRIAGQGPGAKLRGSPDPPPPEEPLVTGTAVTNRPASNPARGRFDTEHTGSRGFDKAREAVLRNAGNLGSGPRQMYDPKTGTLIGQTSSSGKSGWRLDKDHFNWWNWTGGKKGTGGRYGHEFFPPEQAGPHSEHIGYAPWEEALPMLPALVGSGGPKFQEAPLGRECQKSLSGCR